MTDTTPRAGAPLLAANQAQKNITHNEALYQFDALLCARFLDRDLTAPPVSPADGDTYLIKATATGAWAGQDGKIAYCADGNWRFYAPFTGLVAYVVDENVLLVFDGSGWVDYGSVLTIQNAPMLGVNTAADATNKLAVQTNSVLFCDVATTHGGTGDIRTTLSKQASGNTASLLFQDSFSAHAEVGLCGDDNFHFKVSPDGSAWTDALIVNNSNGALGIGMTPSNILDITQNQNAEARLSLSNNSTGTGAFGSALFTNGTHGLAIRMFGTGFTPVGMQRADGAAVTTGGTGGLTLYTSVAQPIYFGINSGEAGRFDAAGNLLIGATATANGARLRVMGSSTNVTAQLDANAGTAGALVLNNAATSGTQDAIRFFQNGAEVGNITHTNSATAYNTSSDARIKRNIIDAENSGAVVDALKVRAFDMAADGSHVAYGMIAQELHAAMPDAVSVGSAVEVTADAQDFQPWGIDYSKLVPLLLAEIQSLRARVAVLERR
jgi:hypothetical protein